MIPTPSIIHIRKISSFIRLAISLVFLFLMLPSIAHPALLQGDTSCQWGSTDCNPSLPDVIGSVQSLRNRGDVMGYNMGSFTLSLSGYSHWQGVQRVGRVLGNRDFLMITKSNSEGNLDLSSKYKGPGGFAIAHMDSRNTEGLRYRSNRLAWGENLEDTRPPLNDEIIYYEQIDTDYDHPGGIQAIGDYVAIPLENSDLSFPAKVVFYNLARGDLPVKKYEVITPHAKHGDVAITKLSDGRYLFITHTSSQLRFFLSTGTTLVSDPGFVFIGTWDKDINSLYTTINDTNWGDYQTINLITQADGALYLLGFNNSLPGGQGSDWLDVFRIDVSAVPFSVTVTKVAKRHFYCTWDDGITGGDIEPQCNFAAASGAYIDPDKRLVVYSVEHWNDGPQGSIKLVEFRSQTQPTSCDTVHDAWAELYRNNGWNGRSIMIDFDDRNKEYYDFFTSLKIAKDIWGNDVGFNDEAGSVRWCMPSGVRYVLYENVNYGGTAYYLHGSGTTNAVDFAGQWMDDTISSGKFQCFYNGQWYDAGNDFTAPQVCPDYHPPPDNPSSVWSTSHPQITAAWQSPDPNITFAWDRPNTYSFREIAGYSIGIDGPPDMVQDIGDVTTYTTSNLPPGIHWLTIRTVDNYGRWNPDYTISESIQIVPECGITVLSPNGGESYEAGTVRTIQWTCQRGYGYGHEYVAIELYKGDTHVLTIADSVAMPQSQETSYTWVVPYGLEAAADYRVKITAKSYSPDNDFSDNYFSIYGTDRITSPNGGEAWYQGNTHTITWAPDAFKGLGGVGQSDIVHINYVSLSEGLNTFHQIAIYELNDGSYSWAIPGSIPTSVDYKVAMWGRSGDIYYSDGYFSIGDTLAVAREGTGGGTVTSSPPGINCGSDCGGGFSLGTIVTLTAASYTGSDFTGWGGACSGSNPTCSVTMDDVKSVTAIFTAHTFPVAISKTGTGSGTVISSPAGIDCGPDCSEDYIYNTWVDLTAVPDSGSEFTGWSGDCTGSGATCYLGRVTSAKSVTATFDIVLTVLKEGAGSGTINLNPPGTDCSSGCKESYVLNSVVALDAAADGNSVFAGWSGDADCLDGIVVMDVSKTCVVTFNNLSAQGWEVRYDGPNSLDDFGTDVVADVKGNVYVTGSSEGDYLTVKYDAYGSKVWEARYNGPGDSSVNFDYATAIAIDGSGNVFVTGYSLGTGTSYDYATIKYRQDDINADGVPDQAVEEWVNRYNGSGNDADKPYDLAADEDGNIYLTGESKGSSSGYDYVTIKYSPDGSQLWIARYAGPDNSVWPYGQDSAYALAVDTAGNVYVTGGSTGGDQDDMFHLLQYGVDVLDYATVKYDSNGSQLWVARYDGDDLSTMYDDKDDRARYIAIDAIGNVYITGGSVDNQYTTLAGASAYVTIKYDAGGNVVWSANYSGGSAAALGLDDTGNVYVTGSRNGDYATLKYDANGSQVWETLYDAPDNGFDQATAIVVDELKNVFVTGHSGGTEFFPASGRDYATIKYDTDGTQVWEARYNGTGSGMDRADAIAMDGAGNVYVAGRSLGLASSYDYATIKYIPDTDNDTISDFWEMTFFGDLLTANETTDYDNDGLPDKFESAHNTDPRNPDSDDDGLPDGYEIANHLDPLDNGSIDPSNGSDGDPDNDYYKNRDEYLAGSSAQERDSFPVNIDIVLHKGLNIFGHPVTEATGLTSYGLLMMLGDSAEIGKILVYDQTSHSFKETFYNGSDPAGDNVGIGFGESVMVYSIAEKTVSFNPSIRPFNSYIECTPVDLVEGLNMATFPCVSSGYTSYQMLADVGGEAYISSIQRFNPDTGSFETAGYLNDQIVGKDFSIMPGEGYIIHLKQAVSGFRP